MSTADNVGIEQLSSFANLIFGQRIAYAIEKKGVSKAWIADKLGISKQALNYLLKHAIKPKFIDEFAELLELDPRWVETGIGNATLIKRELSPRFTAIPIITKSELLNSTKAPQQVRETIDYTCHDVNEIIAFKLEDDSNFPPFIEGSILIFNCTKQPASEDYVLAMIDKDVVVRQYLVDGNNICYKASKGEHKTYINPQATVLGVLIEARYQIS